MKRGITWAVLAVLVFVSPAGAADDLVRDALGRFPRSTAHFEVCEVAKIRPLPGYATLRQRFLGGDMLRMVNSLQSLGVREEDVDRLVMGAGPVQGRPGLEFYGVAQGRFSAAAVASGAQSAGVDPIRINGVATYCFGSEPSSPCVALLNETRGVFGARDMVDFMLYATPATDSLAADAAVSARVAKAPLDASLWGVATGPAVEEWVRLVMPIPPEGKDSLAPLLADVTALGYEVRAGQRVALAADLSCRGAEAAARLRQTFEAARALQQLAWRSLQGGAPNPYESLAFRSQGTQVFVSLAMDYAALGSGG